METQINASLSRRLWAISALLLVAFAALAGLTFVMARPASASERIARLTGAVSA